MVIMTLELLYIFKDYIIKSVYVQCASVKFLENCRETICCRNQLRKKSRKVVGGIFFKFDTL